MAYQALQELYQKRTSDFEITAEQLRKKYQRFAMLRLFTFFAMIAVLILLWQWNLLAGIVGTGVFLVLFYRFTLWHQAIKAAQVHHEALARVNNDEFAVLDHDFSAFAYGASFLEAEHPYSIDLDIFGPHSFFQYTNRTRTVLGRKKLANYLLTNTELTAIHKRQKAIQELASMLDWRQHFLAHGIRTEDSAQQIDLLERWVKQDPFILPKKWLRVVLVILPFMVTLTFSWLMYQQQFTLALLCFIPSLLLMRRFVMPINRVHEQTSHAEKALGHYAKLIRHIEQQSFSSEELSQLRAHFLPDVSKRIKHLSYIISQLNARYNAFTIILNLFGLWDLQWVLRLEKWKQEQREALPKWFDALAAFEALSSLATTVYNNPDWVFPVFTEKNGLSAKALGHPLLHVDKRVVNDVMIPTQGHIKLLTGSNMAGKSTFLRTIGLNIVLANCGMTVCAEEMTLPMLKVYTSMRTQDALHESTSSFYAELKRLKVIIEAVEQKENVFFLLDEILKGTNSRDRHTGSKALIHQLIQQGGGGVIATHDLELGSLEAQYDGTIENWCMEVGIQNEELHFDYKLKKGVSQSFNATILMKQMGINIKS